VIGWVGGGEGCGVGGGGRGVGEEGLGRREGGFRGDCSYDVIKHNNLVIMEIFNNRNIRQLAHLRNRVLNISPLGLLKA